MGRFPRRLRALTGVLAAMTVLPAMTAASSSAAPPDPPKSSPAAQQPVVGGTPADIEEYPWVVYLADPQGMQFCGGIIAAPTKIITAAHCVEGESGAAVRVVAGREDKASDAGTVARVRDIWVHPEYQSPFTGADVSVLTLAERLPQPALPLATEQDSGLYEAGTPATVLGWGATREGGQGSDVLRKAQLPVVSDAACTDAYGHRYSPEAMVCAGFPEGGVDSCQGDSGGPLVAGGKLIGVVSFGSGCGRPGRPGVYVRVAAYQQDLQAQISGTARQ